MNVAKIAPPPILPKSGKRLPTSAQRNPPVAITAIIIHTSFGTLPRWMKYPVSAMMTIATGTGIIPIRNSIQRHHPSGQNRDEEEAGSRFIKDGDAETG